MDFMNYNNQENNVDNVNYRDILDAISKNIDGENGIGPQYLDKEMTIVPPYEI